MKKFSRKGSLFAASVLAVCIVPLAASAEVQCARKTVPVTRYTDESATFEDRFTLSYCDTGPVDVTKIAPGFLDVARAAGGVMNLLAAVMIASEKPLADLERQRGKDHPATPMVSALTPTDPAK